MTKWIWTSEINGALDTIAEFGTQEESDTELPFRLKFNTDATEAEVQALDTPPKQWCPPLTTYIDEHLEL